MPCHYVPRCKTPQRAAGSHLPLISSSSTEGESDTGGCWQDEAECSAAAAANAVPPAQGAAEVPRPLEQQLEAAIAAGDPAAAAAVSAEIVLQQNRSRASLNPLFRCGGTGCGRMRSSSAGAEAPPPLAGAFSSSNPLFHGRSASYGSSTLASRRPSAVDEEGGGETEAAPLQALSSSNPLFRTGSTLSAAGSAAEDASAALPEALSSANPLFDPSLTASGRSTDPAEAVAAEAVAQALAAGEVALGAASLALAQHAAAEALAAQHAADAVQLRVEDLIREAAAMEARLAMVDAENPDNGQNMANAAPAAALKRQLEACHTDLAAAKAALAVAHAESAAAGAEAAALGTRLPPREQQVLVPGAALAVRQVHLLTRLLPCSVDDAEALLRRLQQDGTDSAASARHAVKDAQLVT